MEHHRREAKPPGPDDAAQEAPHDTAQDAQRLDEILAGIDGCLSGPLGTAFPAGAPALEEPADPVMAELARADAANAPPHISVSETNAELVFIADVDFIADDFYIVPGRNIVVADNGALVLNALDALAGGGELSRLRSRAPSLRPMARIDKMRAAAEAKYFRQQAELEASLNEAQGRLEELQAIGEVLKKHPNIMIATDDMYEPILWTGKPFCNILNATPELYDRTFVLNGVSKAYSMTGWRIGYAAGPAKIIGAMKKIQSQSTSNPASISQAAAQAALDGDQACVGEMVKAFKERHDWLVATLNKLPGVECLNGDGTFYVFPSFQGAIDADSSVSTDVEFAEKLLTDAGVALVPGSAFGCPGHMRLSFATSMDNLEKAVERLQKALG